MKIVFNLQFCYIDKFEFLAGSKSLYAHEYSGRHFSTVVVQIVDHSAIGHKFEGSNSASTLYPKKMEEKKMILAEAI
jgi:hypothetical protein